MKKMLKKIGLLASASMLLLSGCATDNTPKPTPLSETAPALINVKILWSRSLSNGNDGENLTIGSVIEGNTLITGGHDGHVVAINLHNGNTLWQTDIGHPISATPGANSTMVFVGTKDGELYALDLFSGKIKWHAQLPSLILGAPAATDDTVVVQTHDSSVVAFASDAANKLWTYQATPPVLTLYSNSSPMINNNVVYVGFDSGQLGAFDLYRGFETWQVPIAIPATTEAVSNMVDLDGTPAMDNGVIFATSYHGTLSAVNSSNGQIIWQRTNSSFESPVIINNKVIVVDETGRVQAFDESTGVTLWQQKNLLYRFISNPAALNNEAVVGDYAGYVHFISLDDGHLLARVHLSNSGIKAAPLIYNNEVIVTTNDGHVVALLPSQ